MPGIGRQTFQAIRNQAAKGNNIPRSARSERPLPTLFYKFRRLTCPASRLRQIVPDVPAAPHSAVFISSVFSILFQSPPYQNWHS